MATHEASGLTCSVSLSELGPELAALLPLAPPAPLLLLLHLRNRAVVLSTVDWVGAAMLGSFLILTGANRVMIMMMMVTRNTAKIC